MDTYVRQAGETRINISDRHGKIGINNVNSLMKLVIIDQVGKVGIR